MSQNFIVSPISAMSNQATSSSSRTSTISHSGPPRTNVLILRGAHPPVPTTVPRLASKEAEDPEITALQKLLEKKQQEKAEEKRKAKEAAEQAAKEKEAADRRIQEAKEAEARREERRKVCCLTLILQ